MKNSDLSSDNVEQRDSQSTEFLLEEFRQNFENWRYVDSRFERVVSYYITVMGAAVAGIGAFFSATGGREFEPTIVVYMFAAPFLVAYGLFVSRRASTTAVLRERHLNSLNLIRRYFLEQDQAIGPYLGRYKTKIGFDKVPLIFVANDEFKQLVPGWHDKTVYFIYVINSFFVALFLGVIFYWFLGHITLSKEEMRMLYAGILGSIFAALSFLGMRQRYERGKARLQRSYA